MTCTDGRGLRDVIDRGGRRAPTREEGDREARKQLRIVASDSLSIHCGGASPTGASVQPAARPTCVSGPFCETFSASKAAQFASRGLLLASSRTLLARYGFSCVLRVSTRSSSNVRPRSADAERTSRFPSRHHPPLFLLPFSHCVVLARVPLSSVYACAPGQKPVRTLTRVCALPRSLTRRPRLASRHSRVAVDEQASLPASALCVSWPTSPPPHALLAAPHALVAPRRPSLPSSPH